MKSLILLRGLDKNQKKNWVISENLQNFFIDYDTFNILYSIPEGNSKDECVLGRSDTSKVFKEFLRAVINRLESGCLVVIDLNLIGTSTIETLSTVYGYTVFNKVFPIPQDYIGNPGKYSIDGFKKKKREDLQKDVESFLNLQLSQTNIIDNYEDIIKFWDNKYVLNLIDCSNSNIHFFSDIHSNYDLFCQLNSKIPVQEYKVFLGDYIDGPKIGGSKLMMDHVLYKAGGYNICLEGNHERRLRKYLYCRWISQSSSKQRQEAAKIIWETLPDEFLCTTAKEFEILDSSTCWSYIKTMNEKLVPYYIIKTNDLTYICTHGGIRGLEQLSPKFIGNAIYGNRDMDEYDKTFSRRYSWKSEYYSIHAHCKYPSKVEFLKYNSVVNLDPEDETQIVYLNTNTKPFNPCIVK